MSKRLPFRDTTPERTCNKVYSQYRSYKPYLVKDFNNRCGYCDDYDGWLGGPATYHIDHFAPKIKFKEQELEYNNLVYSCSYCNRFKSDDWPSDSLNQPIVGNKGYIDPCEHSYAEHFFRDEHGVIFPNSPIGDYIYKKLRFYLGRHKVIWNLSKLMDLKNRLRIQIKDGKIKDDDKLREAEEKYKLLSFKFDEYLNDYLLGDYSKHE